MDPKRLFEQFIGNGSEEAAPAGGTAAAQPSALSGLGGVAGGLAAGGVLGLLLGNKKARKTIGNMAGGAIGLGGAAALGALAHRAYANWQKDRSTPHAGNGAAAGHGSGHAPAIPMAAGPVSQQAFDPGAAPAADGRPFELALIKTMIAAANADQHIDATEQRAIFDSVAEMPLDADEKALVFDCLRSPPTVDQVAALARTREQAVEIYLASRLAIDPDQPAEQRYLEDLSDRLTLPAELVAELNRQAEAQDAVPA